MNSENLDHLFLKSEDEVKRKNPLLTFFKDLDNAEKEDAEIAVDAKNKKDIPQSFKDHLNKRAKPMDEKMISEIHGVVTQARSKGWPDKVIRNHIKRRFGILEY